MENWELGSQFKLVVLEVDNLIFQPMKWCWCKKWSLFPNSNNKLEKRWELLFYRFVFPTAYHYFNASVRILTHEFQMSWIFSFVQNYLITVFDRVLKTRNKTIFCVWKVPFCKMEYFFAENFGAKPLIFWLHRVMIILTREVPFREMAAVAVLTPKESRKRGCATSEQKLPRHFCRVFWREVT